MSGRERMSAVDAAWLHMDRPTNLLVINAVSWFDEPLDWDLVAKLIQTRWVEPYRRFRQRVGEGLPLVGPQWEDDPRFALENHLHHVALPAPGGRAALQDFVGDMMSVPIDRTKPLWHMYLIDGYGQGCALLIRVHHAVADEVLQRGPAARRRQGHMVQVVLQGEPRVILPLRAHQGQPLAHTLAEPAVRLDPAGLDELGDQVPVQRLVEPGDRVDDQKVRRPVHVQPGRVDRGHPLSAAHDCLLHLS